METVTIRRPGDRLVVPAGAVVEVVAVEGGAVLLAVVSRCPVEVVPATGEPVREATRRAA